MRSAVVLCVLATLLSGCLVRSAVHRQALPEGATEYRDLAYKSGPDFDDKKNRLNLEVPKGPGPHPVVVFVHGGGWIFGDRIEVSDPYTKVSRRFASRGILVVNVGYRLSSSVPHPAQIEDVARAIDWTFKHVAEYGGDPSHIFLMGHSAGAHLVSLAACDPRWLAPYGISPAQLAGVIPISGVFDVAHLGRSFFTTLALVRPTFGGDPKVWADVSPLRHIGDGPLPPFFVGWADGDFEILRHDAPRFVDALRRHHVPVETAVASYKGHFTVIMDLGEPGEGLGEAIYAWIDRHDPAPTARSSP